MRDKGMIARQVIESCRNHAYFSFRYMEHALFYLKLQPFEDIGFGSDGKCLFYNPDEVLKKYLDSEPGITYDYLHTVIHCLYLHPFYAKGKEQEFWDLATDIAVADVMCQLFGNEHITEMPRQCTDIIDALHQRIPFMSAKNIAGYLKENESTLVNMCGYDIAGLSSLFRRDNHSPWYAAGKGEDNGSSGQYREGYGEPSQKAGAETRIESDNKPGDDECREDGNRPSSSGAEMDHDGQDASTQRIPSMRRTDQGCINDWKDIAEAMMSEAQDFQKPQGVLPGSMVQELKYLAREKYNYEDFLRKFAVLEETVQLDPDEFDCVYYTYGLNHLGKIALVEPLEYREKYLVKEFVIAVDTSGSCSGDLVQKFLTKTYNILKSKENFSKKVNICIMQCDSEIQDVAVIRDLQELDSYIRDIKIKGLGGTDFRPVFKRVDEMCRDGEFHNLGGIIYFTDGYGTFPARPPKYKTTFVFVGQDEEVSVPPWAMRIYLEEDEI